MLLQAHLYNLDAAGWLVYVHGLSTIVDIYIAQGFLCNVMALAVDHAWKPSASLTPSHLCHMQQSQLLVSH